MAHLRLIVFLLASFISSLVTERATAACGEVDKSAHYSDLPMSFDRVSPQLSKAGLKVKPDAEFGWVIEDRDGAQIFFSGSSGGSSKPCVRETPTSAPICGSELNSRAEKNADGQPAFYFAGPDGEAVAELRFMQAPQAAFFVRPLDRAGSPLMGSLVKIQDVSINVDNTRVRSRLSIEAWKRGKKEGELTTFRTMHLATGGKLTVPPLLVKCFGVQPGKPRPKSLETMDVAGYNFVQADRDNTITELRPVGTIVDVTTPTGAASKGLKLSK